MMASLIGLTMAIALPMSFFIAIAYFVMLFRFKDIVSSENPELWAQERSNGRPFESWAQPAYRLLVKSNGETAGDYNLSHEASSYASTARKLLYAGIVFIFIFISASIAFTLFPPA